MTAIRKFQAKDVTLSTHEARAVLCMYFGHVRLAASAFTDDDRAFAQALLFEGMRRSDSWMQACSDDQLLDRAFSQLPGSLAFAKDLVKRAVGRAGRLIWSQRLEHARSVLHADPFHVAVKTTVRGAIAAEHRSAWAVREASGGPVAY